MPPASTNGKICYIELPATDVAGSAAFFRQVFGWPIRQRGDGATAFDDTTGQVSGAFVTGRTPSQPGLLFYIMVDSVAAACDAVTGGVRPPRADRPGRAGRGRSRPVGAARRHRGDAGGAAWR